jgi:transposase-like protein
VGRQSLYPEEFRKDAVALYRAADGKRTYAAVAADLRASAREGRPEPRRTAGGETESDELARLRAENARLRGAEKEWQLEREILRRAAAYFASMSSWRGPVGFVRYFAAPARGLVACPDVRSHRARRGRSCGLIEACR